MSCRAPCAPLHKLRQKIAGKTDPMSASDPVSPEVQARILSEALPYMQRYDEEIIVVKYGGHAMGNEHLARDFARDIVLLEQTAINPIVVHGGGPQIEASGDIDGWIEQKLASGGRLMGFGRRVFRHRDPRADLLRAALRRLDPDSARLGFLIDVERRAVAALQRRKPGRRVEANIEMDAGLLLDAIGLPRQAFTPVFAVARCAAWLAHAMEQQRTGRMIRPASTYIGPVPAE